MSPADRKIILFDGICNLCNASVQFVLKHDQKKQFLFASLQSPAGQHQLEALHLNSDQMHSFILIEDGKPYQRSAAALRVLKGLGSGWAVFYAFIIIPKFIRDAVYDLVAKYRYRWFGKRTTCWVPTEDLESRFLS